MKTNIYDEIEKLKTEFYKIQCKNWILSKSNGLGAAGRTLEILLNKEEDKFCLPDYNGIELKTKHRYSKYPMELFCMAPDNKPMENARLLKTYGYPDKKNLPYKRFNITITGDVVKEVGFMFSYKLQVDYKNEIIRLKIYQYRELIENSISWSFKELKSRLFHKLQFLALVHVRDDIIYGKKYFKYDDITFYKLRDFDNFLKLVEKGCISVTFKLSYYKSEERKGLIYDKGTSFAIFEEDINELFEFITDDSI